MHPGEISSPVSSVASISAAPIPIVPEIVPTYVRQMQMPLAQLAL